MSQDGYSKEVAANRANWDSRAAVHAGSSFYDLEQYVRDPRTISTVVEWDQTALGDVTGLDLLHLQCHIGTDTISWARLGAHVTGLDFSPESLRVARDFTARARAAIEFVCADVREADRVLNRQFDVVYTSVGILCWLPDVREWARAAAACVRPGGRLYLRDGHPIKATFEYERDDTMIVCVDDYFGDGTPTRDETEFTYTGDTTPLNSPEAFEWKHSLGEIITALAQNGLHIEQVDEYDWLDWQPFSWMVQGEDGRWRFPPGHPRLPLAFSVLASKPKNALG